MKDKVIILNDYYLDERDYKRFGIGTLRSRGFDVEVWSLVNIYFPHMKSNSIYVRTHLENEYIAIGSFKELFNRLRKQNPKRCHIITLLASPFDFAISLKLYALMSVLRLKYSVAFVNPIVSPKTREEGNPLLKKLKNKIISHTVFKPRFCFLSTSKNNVQAPMNKSSKRIYIHTLDYDVYLENKSPREEQNYVVFLDGYYPFHPDYKMHGVKNPISNADKHFDDLCRFFEFIEMKYNTTVVIAAHPRANYADKKDYYKGRKIEYGKTEALVKNCRFAIMHYSTSMSYIVLHNTRALFIADNQILSSPVDSSIIKVISDFFRKPFININAPINEEEIEKELKINEKIYKKYKRLFIKRPHTPEKPFFEVVADYLEGYMKGDKKR